jgi:DNA-binding PadR family transcriptional regulator
MRYRLPSEKELVVLGLLRDGPREMYGLEIVNASSGKLGRAAIYITLARMEEKGYIKSRTPVEDSHPGLPRPRYKITALGERALQAANAAQGLLRSGIVRA